MVYQGSKRRYVKYILPILQKAIDKHNITTFVDGCCGGCNIIDKIKCEHRIAIDTNIYLIALFKEGQQSRLSKLPDFISKENWDYLKAHPNEIPWLTGAAAFFCSYMARGFAGGYNNDQKQYQQRVKNFLTQIPDLDGVEFICQNINDLDIENAVIYIDPPYKATKKYNLQKDFDWDTARRLSEKNYVFVSEQKAPEDFVSIWHQDVTRNCFNSHRPVNTTENLFIYKDAKKK